jgi:hypothetical protein
MFCLFLCYILSISFCMVPYYVVFFCVWGVLGGRGCRLRVNLFYNVLVLTG